MRARLRETPRGLLAIFIGAFTLGIAVALWYSVTALTQTSKCRAIVGDAIFSAMATKVQVNDWMGSSKVEGVLTVKNALLSCFQVLFYRTLDLRSPDVPL